MLALFDEDMEEKRESTFVKNVLNKKTDTETKRKTPTFIKD